MSLARAAALALAAGLVLPAAAAGSFRYDPRLHFRTIATPRFDIHFHQGEEAQARRLAAIAEEIASALDRTLGPATGRVQVILVNQTDLPNGWATPLPYNTIELTAAAPGGESLIGNTDDWLRLVFTHEYTHIVHLGRGAGWIGGLRRVFGRMPLLFPNLTLPLWGIEGIATHQESAVTGQGRLGAGDFRLIAGRAAAGGEFLPLDRANGGLIDWPSGHAPYVYGGLFHEYLVRRYGDESLRRLTDETARRLPYFGALAYRKVFDRSLGELWADFRDAAAEDAPAAASEEVTRLTAHGFSVVGPRFAPDGRLYYSTANPLGFPALMSLAPGGREPREVATRYLGSRLAFAGPEIVFDQMELVAQVGLQSDLHAVRPDGASRRRLTREARAQDPDVSPDGTTVVCTVQRADGRSLATLKVPAAGQIAVPSPLRAEPFTDWTSPRWSPDGRRIAVERRSLAEPSEIVLVDPISGRDRRLAASAEGRYVSPVWTPDARRVIFAASTAHGGFEILSADVETGALARLQGTGPNAQSPDVSPDGTRLVYVGYTPDGFDLFSIPLDTARWTPVEAGAVPASAAPADPPSPDSARDYSPWATLAPRFWTPTFESDRDELVIGAATGGYDALGRHAYGLEAGWSTSRARPDWQAAYAYDRWWPTVFADVSDDTDPFRGGELRTREVNAGVLLPVRRVRWSHALLGAVHASSDHFVRSTGGVREEARATHRSLRTGLLVDAARAYGYSISEADGWSATAGLELTREAFGADGNAGAATLDVRGYVPLGPRHAVLAARAAAATAWGDEAVRRVFSASGNGPRARGFNFGSDAVGLIRGVDESEAFGDHAAVVNVDYRVPLRRIERGAGTAPVFVRTIHGALFADIGHAWTGSFRRGDLTRSVGAELSLDVVLGYGLPLTLTTGAAWRTLPDRAGAVVFGRVGRAF
jgi:hypothetical protein